MEHQPKQPPDVSGQPTLPATEPPVVQGVLQPGTTLGDYRIEAVLGRGGMGTVYRARHLMLDRLVAVKILAQQTGTADPRFLREARNAAKLDHHNIVTVHHAGEAQGLVFIEMQLVDGRSLGEVLRSGPLDPLVATCYVEQVAHALHHAHGQRIVHRDIKPDNLLVTPDGVVKVTDFGLAKQEAFDATITAADSFLGTPWYMAPEQWSGREADARTDLYALGATYFHLVTGQPPFRGPLAGLVRQHLEAPVPLAHQVDPRVPPAISGLIRRMMAKNPAERPQSAVELITELRRLQLELEAPLSRHPGTAHVSPSDVRGSLPAGGTSTGPPAKEVVASTGQAQARGFTEHAPASPTISSDAAEAVRRPGWVGLSLLGVAVAAAILGANASGLFARPELQILDYRLSRRDPRPVTERVALVMVDDDSARAARLSFDRDDLVTVIDAMFRAGAAVVALDLLIADPAGPAGDFNLAQMTADARNQNLVHAAHLFGGVGPETHPGVAVPERLFVPVPSYGLLAANRATFPLEAILRRAKHLGHVAVKTDPDGVVRQVPLLMAYRDKVYPALSLVAASLALGASPRAVHWRSGEDLILAPPRGTKVKVPVDAQGCLRISVRGTFEDRARHSFVRVLELARSKTEEARQELTRLFRGQVVLVGLAMSGQWDVQPMPGMRAPPLVIAHAMAVESMLGHDFIRDASPILPAVLVVLLVSAALAVSARLPWFVALLLVPFGAGACFLVSHLLFQRLGLALPVIAPALAPLGGALAGWGHRLRLEQRQRRVLAEALGRYLPRRLSQQILSDPKALRLGGQRKELSLLSVQLQGFSALSEKLEPEEVGQLLHRFFAVVTEIVVRHEGTPDRFGGEGVRAFFGDPLPLQDHAHRAMACSFELRREVLGLLAEWGRQGRPCPPLGIGVHTGYVTVGNLGSAQRMAYTVVGRAVEIAERLAGAAPSGSILVSGRTRAVTEPELIFERRGDDLGSEVYEACAPRS